MYKHIFKQSSGSPYEVESIRGFAEWLLQVGDGNIGGQNNGEVEFRLPDDILIRDLSDQVTIMVNSTNPSLIDHVGDGR